MAVPRELRAKNDPFKSSTDDESVLTSKRLPQTGTCLHFFLARLLPRFLPVSTLPPLSLFTRWLSFSLASLVTYVPLDRSTTYLQIWHGISAWYPPIGFSFALFIGLGDAAIPSMFLAGFLAGLLNYHQSPTSLEFLIINPLVPSLYLIDSQLVKKRLKPDLRVHSMRDVLTLLLFSLGVSFVAAFVGTAILYSSGKVLPGDYLRAAFNWWIGDAVALSSVSMFLLQFVLPSLRRFLGMPDVVLVHSPQIRQPRHFEFLVFLRLSLSRLAWSLGGTPRKAQIFFIFFFFLSSGLLSVGLHGALVGMLVLDISLAVIMHLRLKQLSSR